MPNMDIGTQVVLNLSPDTIRGLKSLIVVNRFRGHAAMGLVDDYEADVSALVERLDLLRDRARELCPEDFDYMPGKKKKKKRE